MGFYQNNFVTTALTNVSQSFRNAILVGAVALSALGGIVAQFNAVPASHTQTIGAIYSKETSTGALQAGNGGIQVLIGFTPSGDLYLASGSLIIGPLGGPHCTINNDGTYTGCGFTGTGFTLAAGDNRYLRKSGGTETGQLVINFAGGLVDISAKQSVSGAYLHADSGLSNSGTTVLKGQTTLEAGLRMITSFNSCGTLTTDASGNFVCSSNVAAGALFTGTGALQNSFDARYVKQQGGTMSGVLTLRQGASGSTLALGGFSSKLSGFITATKTIDFASLVTLGCEDNTLTATGAALSDVVNVGVPNAAVVTNGEYSAWVSSANTVSIRFCTPVSGDPASGLFRVNVEKATP